MKPAIGMRIVTIAAALIVGAAAVHAASPDSSSVLQLAKAGDRGKLLLIRGRVVDSRGNPMPGVRVRVYHADLHGEYGRYDGRLTTGRDGSYEVRTIRPGSYGGYAAHIHYVVTPNGANPQYFQLLFADDPRRRDPADKKNFPVLPDSLLKEWNTQLHGLRTEEVRPVSVGPDGVHRVERDIRLR